MNDTSKWLSVLVAMQVVNEMQAEGARQEQVKTGMNISKVLESMGISIADQLQAVAQALGTEVVEIQEELLSQELLRQIPAGEARALQCLPVGENAEEISITLVDPFDLAAVDAIQFLLRREVKVVVADPMEVTRLVEQVYMPVIPAHKEVPVTEVQTVELISPVAQIVGTLLHQAIKDRASDVHFEPFEDCFKIRYRVDGALYELKSLPTTLAGPVISRIKVLANLDIAEKRKSQDGRIHFPIGDRAVDLRISCLPTQYGESVVLRILDQEAFRPALDGLGLRLQDQKHLISAIEQPNGILLVTGPTGSGKTTTLYACLNRLNTDDIKILTAEDPVEYEIRGIMQVPINEEMGLGFGRVLRSFLRQDPDVIMIGEMRDLETAQIAIQSSLTGHVVLSTLHTNSAPASVTRLIDMGVEPFLLASSLTCVLAQRLIRICCPHCQKICQPTEKQLRQLGMSSVELKGKSFYIGRGCNACNNTGYRGRKGIFEVMPVSTPIRQLVNERTSILRIRQKAVELGMRTLREDGMRAVFNRESTVEEVLKYT